MKYLYVFGTVFFTVYGQLIIKWRIVRYGALPEGISEKLIFLFKLLLDPFILTGLIAAFVASFFWMAAMTKFDISHVYPIVVGGLAILTAFFAIVFLKEPVSFTKIVGLFFVVLGVYFLSRVS